MLVKINGILVIDEQEKLFQEVKEESFAQFIEDYKGKHWFKEFIYQFTGGEDLVNIDRIKAKYWYLKLVITLKLLRLLLKVSSPSKEQAEEMIVALEELKEKLEVD